MKKIYFDTRVLDKKVRDLYDLTEEIMMENAAAALEAKVMEKVFSPDGKYLARPAVLVLCGKGNNGADGYTLARRLNSHNVSVTVCEFEEPASSVAVIQKKRAVKAGVIFISPYEVDEYIEQRSFDLRVVVDCIFGSGIRLPLSMDVQAVIQRINLEKDPYKIACDIPTGLDSWGNIDGTVFKADCTVTMGALKLALFSDTAKDVCGTIEIADLGVNRCNFENENADYFLLEKTEIRLPWRKRQNTNKGSYGHIACIAGDKQGAAFMAGMASLNFGTGLATIVTSSKELSPVLSIMTSEKIPSTADCLVIGMGFGRDRTDTQEFFTRLEQNIPAVIDADLFYYPQIKEILSKRSTAKIPTVLTPHPKEFAQLLSNTNVASLDTNSVIKNRVELAKKFCEAFPDITLLLKGAVTLIANNSHGSTKIWFNNMGTSALAKAGSGDVLAGMTGALLAQGYSSGESAAVASMVHALAGATIKNNFALTAEKLIQVIGKFEL